MDNQNNISRSSRDSDATRSLDHQALQQILDRYWQSGTLEGDLAELSADKRVALMEKLLAYLIPKAGKTETAPKGFSFSERLRNLREE